MSKRVSPYPHIPSFCWRGRKWRATPQLQKLDSNGLGDCCYIKADPIAMTCWQVVRQEPALPTGPLFLEMIWSWTCHSEKASNGDSIISWIVVGPLPAWEAMRTETKETSQRTKKDTHKRKKNKQLKLRRQEPQRCPNILLVDPLRTIKHWLPNLF